MSQQLNSKYYEKGDIVQVQTLGVASNDAVSNSWILNAATKYNVESITKVNASNFRYRLVLDNPHIFRIGDSITLTSTDFSANSTVINVNSDRSITIGNQGSLDNLTDNGYSISIRRNILKANAVNFDISQIAANVQNVYKDGNKTLVASSSLPFYKDQAIQVKKNTITFSGTFPPVGTGSTDTFKIINSGDHGFYTGDSIYYTPQSITTTTIDIDGNEVVTTTTQTGIAEEGIYFVKRLSDPTQIKLAKSRTQLYNEEYVTTEPISVVDNTIEFYKFKGQELDNQRLFREIPEQNNDLQGVETSPGTSTGILVNGVEVLNYKSIDHIRYGSVEELEVDSGGFGYDVINPPNLVISDSIGTGATGNVAVRGSFNRIDLIDGGFDYINDPKILISGGNGSGAVAEARVAFISHEVNFNTEERFGLVTLGSTSAIGFSTYHKFRDYDRVIYNPNGQTAISGLTTGSSYYVSVQNSQNIKLHKTRQDAITGINTITFSNYGIGRHTLVAEQKKRVISSIDLISTGSNYENKKTTVVGVGTALDTLTIKSHGYSSGEKVVYSTTGSAIEGLTSGSTYYLTKVNDNTVKLSILGPNVDQEFYYRTKQYVNLTGLGSGAHNLNYPEVSVQIIGEVGISSVGSETFEAIIQPIVRGSIVSTNLSSNGVGYGSSEVVNFTRLPEAYVQTGSGVQLSPVVSNGKIIEVIINNGGSNLNSPPDLQVVSETGQGATLVPTVSNGRITSVNVISGGIDYVQGRTSIQVTYPGQNVVFKPKLQTWTINQFEKNRPFITDDDGFIDDGLNDDFGLQYTHLYAPRKLREILYSSDQNGTVLYNNPDLVIENNAEKSTSKYHSPIIGWAYDGNPIYGPFGYSRKSGGVVTQLRSGYTLRLQSNRPPISVFREGFFVEDYEYVNSSDETVLDENNGRFCITPEFPNGTYAYFATLSLQAEAQGQFSNYKKPEFPYLIGNSFYSKPNDFNFKKSSNQNEYNLLSSNWIRNTKSYNLLETSTSYEYFTLPYKLRDTQKAKVSYAAPGRISSVGIITGGTNYKVDDQLIIDDTDTKGFGADIRVSKVGGREVTSVSCSTTSINSIQVLPTGNSGEYSFYSPSPHNFKNLELITISGLSTTGVKLSGQYNIGVTTSTLVLRSGIGSTGTTGIVTYFSVYGSFDNDRVKVNDIFDIEDEKIKILNVDKTSSRIRVLRSVDGTVGTSHSATTVLYEDPRKFTAKVGYNTSFNFKLNRELYFNPSDTVAIGTQSGVGIGSTIVFSNPGAGLTQFFAPTQTLYIPGHELNTGDELVYNLNGGSVIGVSTNGISTSVTLSDQSKVYVAKITNDLIGLSTVKIGLSSTGTYAGTGSTTSSSGLLYFTSFGSGDNHSFQTNYSNVVSVSAFKNTVTVSTSGTHGLNPSDTVYVDVKPSISTSFAVSYNDYNRRLIINKKTISSADINILTNEITITDHGFDPGQKLIYTASSPAGGLVNEKIYYVVIVNQDIIKLSETYYSAVSIVPTIVDITSAADSFLSPVNPPIKLYKNSSVEFDLSDISLTYVRNSISYPAFKFILYIDQDKTTEFEKVVTENNFSVTRTGTVGVDGKLTLSLSDTLPTNLYYDLVPISELDLPTEKLNIVSDDEVKSYGQLLILDSKYSGTHRISIASTNTFRYYIPQIPETTSYTQSDASIRYSTDSSVGIGSIAELKIFNSGSNYYKLPAITGVISGLGSGAIFEISSENIGEIKKIKLNDIGFDYPYDKTVKPTAKLPQIFKINNLSILDRVGITSFGFGYGNIPPKILLFDGKTGDQKTEVDLRFEFGTNQINIVENTFGINNLEPRLLPVQNSNGVGISTITYDSNTKDVTVTLATGFSTANSFPFTIGDEIMIENASVGIASTNPNGVVEIVDTGRGYNTENYDYKLFIISGIDENLGGIGIVTFSLDGYLNTGELPGTFNPDRSSARIIPRKHFPTFDIDLTTTNFIDGEEIICLNDPKMLGTVQSWDNKNGYLKVNSNIDFSVGHLLEGVSSKTRGTIDSIINFSANYNVDASSRVESGWEEVTGFLNNTSQVIQDGDYYQKFSYSLKSKVALEKWDDVVSSLNHAAGFKKFSNLIVENSSDVNASVGLGTTQSYFDRIIEFTENVNMNCVYSFDIVRENFIPNFSDRIFFNNKTLTDYSESVGNRVLSIDNFSNTFNSNPRPTRFSEVTRWSITDTKAHKFLTYVQDTNYTSESQLMFVTLLHDSRGFGYLNQYGRLETQLDLGSFDFALSGTDGILNFYPNKFEDNFYNIFTLSYNLGNIVTSTSSDHFGGSVKIESTSQLVSVGSTTNIVSIGNTYNSAKVLVEIKTEDGGYEYEELTILHDGSDVNILEYGQLTNEIEDPFSGTSGFGTFHPYIDGSNIKIDFVPNVSVASSINTVLVAISSEGTGIGSFAFNHALIGAVNTSIASSASPVANSIAEYPDTYNAGYFIAQVSDPDNNTHQVSEIMLVDDGPDFSNTYITEFGVLETSSGLGTFGASKIGDITRLTFTPNSGINAEVRVFYNYMKYEDDGSSIVSLDFTNAYLDTQYGSYSGTNSDLKRSFNLTHQGYNIFERYIDASDENIIGVGVEIEVPDAIIIPNHFFVTGEELVYSTPGAGTTENIGIATTSVTGVGTTDKLPSSVFVVKVDANKIKLAESAEKALRTNPEVFDIVSVGIGTSHTFTATNQNAKVIIAIDNYLQSPVVSTALTTTLSDQFLTSQDAAFFSGISSFFGGDLIQIGSEIMQIQSVGVGSTNIVRVKRPWLGTTRVGYSTGDLVTKVTGNYNIVNNTLNFVEAPYGNNPLSTTSNPPDARDWTGITTSSNFQGRVFLRSGTPGGSSETYSKNYIFDDISENFTGMENEFTLSVDGSNVTGIEDENAVLLINDIFQIPGLINDYTLSENAGITSAIFNDDGQQLSYDINSSNLPIGGVIVSVGSSAGFGYQPLVSAGGTAIVSIAGTISSISIGNTGSGYRADTKYEILTSVATTVSAGSTIITLNNNNSVFGYLNLLSVGSTCTIGVGTYIKNTNIISAGTTSVNIGIGSTSPYEILSGTSVSIEILDPQIGVVRVGVASSSVGITTVTHVGFASIRNGHILSPVTITNVASGYTSTNPPNVIIESPLSYSNIPLVYQQSGLATPSLGIGTQAKIDIVVGFGSDIIDFSVSNTGFGYRTGQYLTVPTGGPTGIPTNPTLGGNFENFTIIVKDVYSDKFAGWSIGQLQPIDDFSNEFDGRKTDFQIKIGGIITSIRSSKGSNINIQDTLIVFYNNILQVPGEAYTFNGGSTIIFPEPPKSGDIIRILFYKGSGSVDVVDVDVLETVKEGDTLQIVNDPKLGQSEFLEEDPRVVLSINSVDVVSTNPYFGPGNTSNINLERPVIWCRQTEDLLLNGRRVAKDRDLYKAMIYPSSNIINTVGVGSTTIYVENVFAIFNPQNESDISLSFQKDILLVSQDEKVAAAATAVVSLGGTISSVVISDGGVGYTTSPAVIIGNPVGLGTTQRANATASITNGVVTSITITGTGGTGYASTTPPTVLIEPPAGLTERINSDVSYSGDFGQIVGVAATSIVGVASTGLILSLFIPNNSVLKDEDIVGTAITVSSLSVGDYFVVKGSNVGTSLTSLSSGSEIVGVGTTCIDNVYQVVGTATTQRNIAGVGTTTVNNITVSVLSYNGYNFSSLGVSTQTNFGTYSWGKITTTARTSEQEFGAYNRNGVGGISTSPYVRRYLPLKIQNYIV